MLEPSGISRDPLERPWFLAAGLLVAPLAAGAPEAGASAPSHCRRTEKPACLRCAGSGSGEAATAWEKGDVRVERRRLFPLREHGQEMHGCMQPLTAFSLASGARHG